MKYSMKCCLVLFCIAVMLFSFPAQADDVATMLMAQEGASYYLAPNDIDVIIRPSMIPFSGTADQEDMELCAFIDYVQLAEERITAMRLVISLAGEAPLYADSLSLRVGKKTYTFVPARDESEYDMMYYEDYSVCLSPDGMSLISALCKGSGSCTVTLSGDRTVTGTLVMPADEVKAIYKTYQEAGGLNQDLSVLAGAWPVAVDK